MPCHETAPFIGCFPTGSTHLLKQVMHPKNLLTKMTLMKTKSSHMRIKDLDVLGRVQAQKDILLLSEKILELATTGGANLVLLGLLTEKA
jgi:hypothetical protein